MKFFLSLILVVLFFITQTLNEVSVIVEDIIPHDSQRETIYVISHGVSRLVRLKSGKTANRLGWPAQLKLERMLAKFMGENFSSRFEIVRAHEYDEELGHGFIHSQKMGMEVFKGIPKKARLIVAISVWCFSHHILAGLQDHEGPILLLANWSGEMPGLVGMLNLAASLTKIEKPYSRLWTKDGEDKFFQAKMREWLMMGYVKQDFSHMLDLGNDIGKVCSKDNSKPCEIGVSEGRKLKEDKAIMCIFDEGCMGMANAIFEDKLVNAIGVYKERLSQSYLVSQMALVEMKEKLEMKAWLDSKGFSFKFGKDPATELTEEQVLEQMGMYVSVLRIADSFGCDLVGIQYQQGLIHSCAASDLVEGMLNNVDRPPVFDKNGKELYEGEPLVHFNEVDEGAGVDALVTNKICNAFDIDPANTLHDIRYGEEYEGKFVWVFEISGSVPPSHLIGGWSGSSSERQPPMYFPFGGGSLKGISKPGRIIWSRVYIKKGELHCDIGTGTVITLPMEETERRWKITNPQWPIMHAVLDNVSRNQLMGYHNANHIQVVYAPKNMLDDVLKAKMAMLMELGIKVHLAGRNDLLQNNNQKR